MFKREIKKQNKILRTLLKLMNVYAIDKENFDFVNPNIKNNRGETALFLASSFYRNYSILKELITHPDIDSSIKTMTFTKFRVV